MEASSILQWVWAVLSWTGTSSVTWPGAVCTRWRVLQSLHFTSANSVAPAYKSCCRSFLWVHDRAEAVSLRLTHLPCYLLLQIEEPSGAEIDGGLNELFWLWGRHPILDKSALLVFCIVNSVPFQELNATCDFWTIWIIKNNTKVLETTVLPNDKSWFAS